MYTLSLIYLFIITVSHCQAINKIYCPSHCICDKFEKHKRAMCNYQNLVVVEAEIPIQVEILDLSHNLIHELYDHIFVDLNLTQLKLLNLSHNKISQIHMNAFSDMKNIQTIDLSYNNIEYLLENWFWNIQTLEKLYLQGNNLRKLWEAPILESKSLKLLNLAGCSLSYIHEDAFSKLPNLQHLNLSNNNLIQLKANVIKPLIKLKILDLENCAWQCDDVKGLISYCKLKEIKCTEICNLTKSLLNKEEKFQKMIIASTAQPKTSENFWIDDNIEDTNQVNEKCSCFNDTSDINKSLLLEIVELSPILALIIPLLFGLFLGLIVAYGISIYKPRQNKPAVPNKRNMRDPYIYPLLQREAFEVSESTPMPLRRSIHTNKEITHRII